MRDDYTYETAGFDGFLSRSIDNLSPVNLDADTARGTGLAYDRAQLSGIIGDVFKMGSILFDGKNNQIVLESSRGEGSVIIDGELANIRLADDSNNRIVIGSYER